MRFLPLLALVLVGSCASTKQASPFPAAQAIVDDVAGKHPEVLRLTLHAVPSGSTQCTQLASTMAARRGKPSDPEDLEALRSGEAVVLEEPGALDVTVPILVEDGAPKAVAGVTLRAPPGSERTALEQRARAIAEELADGIRSARQPLW